MRQEILSRQNPVTRNRVAEGRVIYAGTHLARSFADSLASWLPAQYSIAAPFAMPEVVELSTCEKAGKRILFVMNFSRTV